MAQTKKEREKEEEKQERIANANLEKVRKAVEQQLKNEYKDYDVVRVHYLYSTNYRWNAWKNNSIVYSEFVQLTPDGLSTIR